MGVESVQLAVFVCSFFCHKTSRMFVQRALSKFIFSGCWGLIQGHRAFHVLFLKYSVLSLSEGVGSGCEVWAVWRAPLWAECEVRLSHHLSLSLLALGLKHFEGTEFPKPLISKYLVTCKTAHQLTVRIKNLNLNRAPNNVIKVSECENSLLLPSSLLQEKADLKGDSSHYVRLVLLLP